MSPESRRRAPTQARSQQRRSRILDAAAEVFAKGGFDRATTAAIAERAGTPIGSFYQFFPNKEAVFRALAVRYLGELREVFDRVLAATETEPIELGAAVDTTVDAFASYYRKTPGFRAVWLRAHVPDDLRDEETALQKEFVRRTDHLLAALAPTVSRERRKLAGEIIVHVISALLALSVRESRAHGDGVLSELKTMLRAYLAPMTTPPEKTSPPTRKRPRSPD